MPHPSFPATQHNMYTHRTVIYIVFLSHLTQFSACKHSISFFGHPIQTTSPYTSLPNLLFSHCCTQILKFFSSRSSAQERSILLLTSNFEIVNGQVNKVFQNRLVITTQAIIFSSILRIVLDLTWYRKISISILFDKSSNHY